MTWISPDGGIGLQGRRLSTLPFYGSERIPSFNKDEWIFIVEGEKTADAVLSVGKNALGTFGASNIPETEILSTLRDRKILLCPDNDEPGYKHMMELGAKLKEFTSSQLWLDPPDGAEKGWDLADGIAEKGIEIFEELRYRLREVPEPPPPEPRPEPRRVKVKSRRYADIKAKIDLTEYISRYSEIRKTGTGYKFHCPLHEDKHPSAHIYREQRRWWCFVCDRGGDVIDYERARSHNERALPE